jgi:hypothetical protein
VALARGSQYVDLEDAVFELRLPLSLLMKTRTIALPCILFISACGLFDSGIEWQSGRYAVIWIDSRSDMNLSLDVGQGSWAPVVAPAVFAVGSNDHYIVAKQHPAGDTTVTNYFIVDVQTTVSPGYSAKGVIGPLSQSAFEQEGKVRPLPPFTKIFTPQP